MKPRQSAINRYEALGAVNGYLVRVSENYHRSFLRLRQGEVERMALAVMLDLERRVRRLSRGRITERKVEAVARMVNKIIYAIAIGVVRFDAFGRLVMAARENENPSTEKIAQIERKCAAIEPIVAYTVRQALPWLMSRVVSQGQLPL